jgi:hypothetical protein
MDDAKGEQLEFDDLKLDTAAAGLVGGFPVGFPAEISGNLIPVYINRTGFDRTVINFGGKLLIDALKWFDLELSTNFGLWEYRGQIVYPVSLALNPSAPSNPSSPEQLFDFLDPSVDFDTLDVTCEELGLGYWGIDNTPYAKFHLDLTVRKSFVTVPKRLKTFSLYGGGGFSLHFATPVLSAGLIEEVLAEKLQTTAASVQALGADLLGSDQIMKTVLEEIIAGLSEPKFGMHLVLGTQLKIPVIPVAFYADGKLMIPFGDLDPNLDLNGYGFLANVGVMLKF